MSKFTKKLISSVVPAANATGVYSAVEQLQNLTALTITAVNPCADINGTDGGLGDDTAVNTAGGFVKITGSGFVGGTTKVYINGVQVVWSYLNSTTIVATVPAGVSGTVASLIVFNGATVGSIWAAGISYSGFPTWTTSALTGSSLAVNAQLVAVGDAPLVYTFVSGTLPPNCTISSSGLLSGTITGVTANTIYTFTVAVTDAQNQNVSQSIVYTLVVSDPYYRFTNLHVTGDSNPTWITDASSNALAITPAGAPQSTTFSPLTAGYYANSFDGVPGTNIKLVANSAYNLSSGQYFIQAFCYPLSVHSSANGNSNHTVISQGNNANNVLWQLAINTTGTINWGFTGAGVTTSTTYPVVFDTWNHIAISRDASNVERIFLNGKLVNQRTNTTNFNGVSDYATRIGSTYDSNFPSAYSVDAYGNVFNGYISNLQMVVGNIPVYFQTSSTTLGTTIFTTPTSPATNVTGTVLLTCQSNRFVDNSTTAAAILTSAVPKVVSSNPFNLPAGLASYGSGYFNGSSCLSVPTSTNFGLGTGDFTIEFWLNLNSQILQTIFSMISVGDTQLVPHIYYSASNIIVFVNGASIITGSVLSSNTWYHIALVKSSGSTKLFINGTQSGSTYADTNTYLSTAPVTLGDYRTTPTGLNQLNGYLSNVRVVKGTAVYTAAFTPPTAPLTAITNTSLLTLQTNVPHNNSQFRDTSTNNALITRFGNTTQGSFSPFTKQYPYSTATVGGSAYFDGTGDYLSLASGPGAFGSGNFTIECWFYVTSVAPAYQAIVTQRTGDTTGTIGWSIRLGSSTFAVDISDGTTNYTLSHQTAVVVNTWYHGALVRSGNSITLYLNGVGNSSPQTVASGYTLNGSGTTIYVGYASAGSSLSTFNGYISNLRLVKTTAVYTSNFTPSTTPLTATASTTLLLTFTDAAVYDNTMTNNLETVGNVQANTSVFKYGTGALKFNGTTDYLITPAKATFYFAAGDFTIEGWFYKSANGSAGYDGFYQLGVNGSVTDGFSLEISSTRGYVFFVGGIGIILQYNVSPNDSTWHHVAVSRSGNNTRLFVDGTQQAIYTSAYTIPSTATVATIGTGVVGSYPFNGYIDDLRITKGAARYTAAFTPSTNAFSASAPVGTSTLIPKSLRFRSSASAYLSRTASAAISTFTLSMWVKRGALTSNYQYLFSYRVTGDEYGLAFNLTTDTLYVYSGTSQATTAVFRDPAAWYHIVLSNNAGAFTLYVNNVSVKTGTIATIPSGALLDIGRYGWTSPNYYFDGEMAEVNFVDGVALDPTVFGAYSAYNQWLPISYSGYQGVNGFYLPFTGSTATSYAGSFNGSSKYLNVNSVTAVGTGDFTVEAFVYFNALGDNAMFQLDTAGQVTNWSLSLDSTANKFRFFVRNDSATTNADIYSSAAAVTNQWYHVAGVVSGTTATLYVNGISVASATLSGVRTGTGTTIFMGQNGASNGRFLNGYMSNNRYVKGTAVYTVNFIPPTANLTNITNTVLLTLQNATIVDNSSNGYTITNNGTVTTSVQSPFGTPTIAADSSGNANNWTPNNISLTAGSTYDSLTDVPTLTSTTAANYAVVNALNPKGGSTVSNGNLTEYITGITGGRGSSIAMTSGKFYCEVIIVSSNSPAGGGFTVADVGITSPSAASYILESSTSAVCYYSYNGYKYVASVASAYGTAWSAIGTYTIGMALDVDAGTLQFYLNNAGQGNITLPTKPSDGWIFIADWESSGGSAVYNWNFGQQPWTYTPPTGFLALNTYNI